ncbi:MAG: hypothetical protein LBQ61_00535 [Spirochaetales bacterium]|jgi:hypothetical protein|nr:hypothetical protein [Spirochaetales bacterium]
MRIIFGLMAGGTAGSLLVGFEGGIPWMGAALLGLCLWGLFYEERWIFAKPEIETRMGLLFFYKRRRFKIEEVKNFLIYSPGTGRTPAVNRGLFSGRGGAFCLLAMQTAEGKQINIELIKSRGGQAAELKQKALVLSAYCEKPLIEENI